MKKLKSFAILIVLMAVMVFISLWVFDCVWSWNNVFLLMACLFVSVGFVLVRYWKYVKLRPIKTNLFVQQYSRSLVAMNKTKELMFGEFANDFASFKISSFEVDKRTLSLFEAQLMNKDYFDLQEMMEFDLFGKNLWFKELNSSLSSLSFQEERLGLMFVRYTKIAEFVQQLNVQKKKIMEERKSLSVIFGLIFALQKEMDDCPFEFVWFVQMVDAQKKKLNMLKYDFSGFAENQLIFMKNNSFFVW